MNQIVINCGAYHPPISGKEIGENMYVKLVITLEAEDKKIGINSAEIVRKLRDVANQIEKC